MITEQHTEEALCRAYLHAVAGRAGHVLELGDRSFDYGVDGSIKQVRQLGNLKRESGFAIDIQAKASVNWTIADGVVKFDLDVDTYNYLASRASEPRAVPILLVVLCLPKQSDDWLSVTEKELILKKCLYWHFPDTAPTSNTTQVRVNIPADNTFTPETITSLLDQVAEGTLL
ncbi:MAG: DUF4365 domain-containing protein [Kiritimatiellia bacterium]|jgi:hypothetical protein|nr:DUF4365 domain-containing protein [Kiritimatiellia bacterium]